MDKPTGVIGIEPDWVPYQHSKKSPRIRLSTPALATFQYQSLESRLTRRQVKATCLTTFELEGQLCIMWQPRRDRRSLPRVFSKRNEICILINDFVLFNQIYFKVSNSHSLAAFLL